MSRYHMEQAMSKCEPIFGEIVMPPQTCPDIDAAQGKVKDAIYYLKHDNCEGALSLVEDLVDTLEELRAANHILRQAAMMLHAELADAMREGQ